MKSAGEHDDLHVLFVGFKIWGLENIWHNLIL